MVSFACLPWSGGGRYNDKSRVKRLKSDWPKRIDEFKVTHFTNDFCQYFLDQKESRQKHIKKYVTNTCLFFTRDLSLSGSSFKEGIHNFELAKIRPQASSWVYAQVCIVQRLWEHCFIDTHTPISKRVFLVGYIAVVDIWTNNKFMTNSASSQFSLSSSFFTSSPQDQVNNTRLQTWDALYSSATLYRTKNYDK